MKTKIASVFLFFVLAVVLSACSGGDGATDVYKISSGGGYVSIQDASNHNNIFLDAENMVVYCGAKGEDQTVVLGSFTKSWKSANLLLVALRVEGVCKLGQANFDALVEVLFEPETTQ